jgi:hypothetical protein
MNFKHYKNVSEIVVNEDYLAGLRKRLAWIQFTLSWIFLFQLVTQAYAFSV